MKRVMAQHFFDGVEFQTGLLVGLVMGKLFLFGLAGRQFRLAFHSGASSGFFKEGGESFAGAMELAPNGIGCLLGQRANLFIAELFIGDEEEQKTVFSRQAVQRFLNALPEFLGFENTERGIGFSGRIVPDRIVGVAEHVPVVPGLLDVAAMIDGDAIKPGAPRGFATE